MREAVGVDHPRSSRNILQACLMTHDILSFLRDPKWKNKRHVFANKILNDITNILNCKEVQNACDKVGISTKGYQAL